MVNPKRYLKASLVSGFIALGATVTMSQTVIQADKQVLPVPEHRKAVNHIEFLGQWEGAWDDVWTVHLTVTLPEDQARYEAEELDLLYQWVERRGQPMREQRRVGRVVDGVLVADFLEMYLHPDDTEEAILLGRFRRERSADMIRVPSENEPSAVSTQ